MELFVVTRRTASITGCLITVIAGLAHIQDAVAATRESANTETTVGIDPVAIVAFLSGVAQSIAARGSPATEAAEVGHSIRVQRSVIALFAVLADAVAAEELLRTVAGAAVAARRIAIVAVLPRPDSSIPAAGFTFALRAPIATARIAIIALLSRIPYAVATMGRCAIRPAGAGHEVRVAVPGIAHLEKLRVGNTVAAARKRAIGAAGIGQHIRIPRS